MSFNIRLTIPAGAPGVPSPFTIPGTNRTYSCAAGSTLDVNDSDARILQNVGWVAMTPKDGSVGPTSSRPAHAHIGMQYIDSTLNIFVVSDGNGNWLNAITGVAS